MMADKDLDKITEPRAAAADIEQHIEAENSVETEKGGKTGTVFLLAYDLLTYSKLLQLVQLTGYDSIFSE